MKAGDYLSAATNEQKAATTYEQLTAACLRAQGCAADVAAAAARAIEAVQGEKENKHARTAHTIQANGWTKQTSGTGQGADAEEGNVWQRYPYYHDFAVEKLTAAMAADADIQPESMETAKLCGFCTAVTTRAGYIRVRAQKQPGAAIKVIYTIREGVTG